MPTAAIIGGSVLGAISSRNSSKKAAGAAKDTSTAQIAATDRATSQARGDLFKLFPSAEANAQQGSQAALDVFGQFMPQQANTFQQGNMNAQNQILAGMPQAQNALMGGAVDYSQFQPKKINFDASMFQQQLPDFQNSQQALNPMAGMTSPQVPFNQGALDNIGGVQVNGPNSFLGGRMGNGGAFNNSGFNMQNMRIR
jgi:hypothetical protein